MGLRIEELSLNQFYHKKFNINEEMGQDFARISGDYNPIHLNEDYAKSTIFKRKIAHGMLVVSFISAVIGQDFPGEGSIYLKQNINFLKPAYYGDNIEVRVTITNIIMEKSHVELLTECFNQKGDKVISGSAKILLI